MSTFLSLLLFFSLVTPSHPQPQSPKGILIDCGATVPSVIDGRKWLPDADFISTGTPRNITISDVVPILSTLRSFPLGSSPRRKFCYSVPVYRIGKYMVRTTYFYGGINGRDLPPPVFDQIVDGTFWSVVNTTEDYAREMSSYYEGVFVAGGKKMTVCIAANTYTDSDPFISALELVLLNDSVYNSTDFEKFGLSLVARHIFGYGGPIIRYPDDQFDRYWQPFGENNPTAESIRSISVSGFWNLPPLKIFETELTRIEFQWPPAALPNSTYYIALYFADNGYALSGNARVFNISINGMTYYSNLNATPAGAAVFATRWPLAGLTNITLTPAAGSDIAPLINAGEVFNVLLLGGKTLTRDGLVP